MTRQRVQQTILPPFTDNHPPASRPSTPPAGRLDNRVSHPTGTGVCYAGRSTRRLDEVDALPRHGRGSCARRDELDHQPPEFITRHHSIRRKRDSHIGSKHQWFRSRRGLPTGCHHGGVAGLGLVRRLAPPPDHMHAPHYRVALNSFTRSCRGRGGSSTNGPMGGMTRTRTTKQPR